MTGSATKIRTISPSNEERAAIMVVESDGYIALIEYLVESLGLFESQQQGGGAQTIEDLVSNRVADNLMAICEQNPQLDPKVRFLIMQEADAVVADLEEVLSAVWLSAPSEAQQAFLIEFIDLIKNLFDSTIS
jgi:hypothetical protein